MEIRETVRETVKELVAGIRRIKNSNKSDDEKVEGIHRLCVAWCLFNFPEESEDMKSFWVEQLL